MSHNPPQPMTAFRPARRARRNPSVTDDAIDKIQKLIISGSWGPGDRLRKDALRAKLEQMVESETVAELVEADVDFHAIIARATGNTFLTSLLASLSSRTMRARMWRGREVDNVLDVTRDEHRRIYEAIVAGDPELARAAAMAHIASGERWLRAQLASDAVEASQAPAEVGG